MTLRRLDCGYTHLCSWLVFVAFSIGLNTAAVAQPPGPQGAPSAEHRPGSDHLPVSEGGDLAYELKGRTHRNYIYGFALTLPKALAGEPSDLVTSGMHGVDIELGTSKRGTPCVVAVYAAYDEAQNADEAADFSLEASKEEGGEITVRERKPSTLGSVPAIRVQLLRRKGSDAGEEETIEETITAVRAARSGARMGRAYFITLITVPSRYEQDVRLFDEMLRSWQMLPLGNEE